MEQETSISFVLFLLVSSYQPTLQLLGAARELRLESYAVLPRDAIQKVHALLLSYQFLEVSTLLTDVLAVALNRRHLFCLRIRHRAVFELQQPRVSPLRGCL